ncbi:MAG: tetratricopeptide repeat protein [Anaerolineales bacterium]|nr:tetratricopeptide repeat protein [Anaerolineales bacterium]
MRDYGYLRREQSSLTQGYLFGRRKGRGISPLFLLAWGMAMAGVLYVIANMQTIQPQVLAMVAEHPTITPGGISYAQRGDQAFWAGDLDAAVENYRRAANSIPNNISIIYELARILIYRSYGDVRNFQDIDEALTWAGKAIQVAPENPRAYAIYCFALVRAGKSSDASRECLRALDFDPNAADAHAYLSMASFDLRRTATALDEAEKAVRLDPKNIDANIAYARTLSFQGRVSMALTHYEAAASVNMNLEFPYFEMAFFAYNLANRNNGDEARYRIAINAYETVLKRNPKSVKAYTRLCQTYLAKGEPKLARQYCMEATEVDPGYTAAWRWLGEVYHKSRNYEDAVDAFAECQRQEIALGLPTDARDPTCWWLQGVGYFILGQCDRAIPLLEEVLRWTTDDIAIRETNRTLLKCATAYQGTYKTPTPVPTATPRPTPIL